MKRFLYVCVAASLLFSGCVVDEGDPGPPGPQGPQGPQGNANVISLVGNVQASGWGAVGTFGQVGYGYLTQFSVPELTTGIYNNGLVLVYLQLTNGSYLSLPATLPYDGYSTSWLVTHNVGLITLEVYDSDFQTTNPGAQTLKIVLVPNAFGKAPTGLNLADYEAVKAYYNLKD